jgi:hypothetical protein
MKVTIPKLVLCLTMAVYLVSCASSNVSVKETWRSPDAPTKSYKKLLVVGITANHNLRDSFENIFSETLSDHGVEALPSYKLVRDLTQADHIKIKELAEKSGADAVVITHVLSKSEHASYILATGHAEQRTVVETKSAGNSSTTITMSAVGFSPGEMDSEGATLQTRLFDATSTKLVWSAISHAAGADNDKIDVCWQLSALLTKALSKDTLIEINSKEFHQPKL